MSEPPTEKPAAERPPTSYEQFQRDVGRGCCGLIVFLVVGSILITILVYASPS